MTDEQKPEQKAKQDKSAFLELARDRFRMCEEAEAKNRADSLDDLRFYSGDQWPDHIKRQRDLDKRPCLTLDRLGQFVRQITNEIRKNIPGIEVGPVDSAGDPDTAEVIEGTIRHIEYLSDANVAKSTAAEYAVIMGFGYYRLRADYCDPLSMDQDILFEAIPNPFSVYGDPNAIKADRSDSRFWFIVKRMPLEEFKREHPNSETTGASDFSGLGDRAPTWFLRDEVVVAEYYHLEYEKITLCRLATGQDVPLEDVPQGVQILKQRTSYVPRVKWAKITGVEVLEERTLPGTILPVIPVYGEELIVDGERILRGIVRTAKDAQAQYNFFASAETEAIALAPRAPYIMAEGQQEGYEALWNTANTRNHPFLLYRPKSIGQDMVPPPQRQSFEPAIQAISQARMQASSDMQAATAIYPAALGAQSNETSGKAILARQSESDNANAHFQSNVKRADLKAFRILLEWIPVYYGRDRVLRIIGAEGEQKTVRTGEAQPAQPGLEQIYDLTTGKYDVVYRAGPNAATKREAAVESMSQIIQAYPQIMQIAGDLMVENMDFPGARGLAQRLKKTLPPELQDEGDKKQPIPPQAQAQLAQSAQMIDQLTQQLNQLTDELHTRKFELDSKERIEMARLELQKEELTERSRIELIKLGSAEDLALLKEEIAALQQKFQMLMQTAAAERDQENAQLEQQNTERQQQLEQQNSPVSEPAPDAPALA